MSTKHTPTPWVVGFYGPDDQWIRTADGDAVCEVGHNQPNAEEIRTRIIHAVNNHEALIAALTWLLDDLTDAGEDKSESGETFDSVAAARTALANAKGTP